MRNLAKSSCLLFLFSLLWLPPCLAAEYHVRVTWIYDGDTVAVEPLGKVRLLGIDTPEYKSSERDIYYIRRFEINPKRLREISAAAKDLLIDLLKGRPVRLVTEQQERDRYGRLLAYVYLPDGRLLNRLLLEQGLATVFRRYTFSRKEEFLTAEKQARGDRRGLWRQ